jgi:hypothetical protein
MNRFAVVLNAVAILSAYATAQSPVTLSPAADRHAAAQEGVNLTSVKGFVLEEGTPIRLRINRTISSADAHTGDSVDFEVLDDIRLNGVLVIPKGSLAFATITDAEPKRRMA